MQVRAMYVGALPERLTPNTELTEEEQADLGAYLEWAQTQDSRTSAATGFTLFLEQRRKTRTWVLYCSTTAAALGLLAGWLAWGRGRI